MEARFKEFEEVQRAQGALATRALGIVHVPIAEIVGSVGRARYFPLDLRPGCGLTPLRGRGLVTALNRGVIFPAVLLCRIGHEYFIADGHHRIAAYRRGPTDRADEPHQGQIDVVSTCAGRRPMCASRRQTGHDGSFIGPPPRKVPWVRRHRHGW